eukprot:scaffold160_cov157-Skeletonema_menzelii.AAC.10
MSCAMTASISAVVADGSAINNSVVADIIHRRAVEAVIDLYMIVIVSYDVVIQPAVLCILDGSLSSWNATCGCLQETFGGKEGQTDCDHPNLKHLLLFLLRT